MYRVTSRAPYAIATRPDGRERVICMLGGISGQEFVYAPTDPASKDAALRAFEEYANGVIAQIQSNLGRRLTDKELRSGLQHPEDEDEFTRKNTKAERDAVFAPAPDPRNWAERMLDEHKAAKKRERDPKQAFLEEQVEKLAANEMAAKEKAKRDADPRRQKCIADAQATRLAALFDPTLPVSEIRAADFRLHLAKEGDVKLYAHEKNEYQARQAERLSQLSQPHLDGLAKHREAIRQLSRPFELPAVSIEYEPGESIDPDAEYRRFASTPGTYSHESQPLSNRLQPQEDQQ